VRGQHALDTLEELDVVSQGVEKDATVSSVVLLVEDFEAVLEKGAIDYVAMIEM
jgi:hypothetical protein